MPQVYSTLTNAHCYTNWTRPSDKTLHPEVIGKPVTIKGGANLATSPESNMGRRTPKGVVTDVTDEQLEYLRQNKRFLSHEKQELIFVISSKEDPDKVARDMNPKDNAAPITPAHPKLNEKPKEERDGLIEPLRARAKGVVDAVKNAFSSDDGEE